MSFLQLAGVGVATGVMLPLVRSEVPGERASGTTRATVQLARQLFAVIESRDAAAIWTMFADGGVIEYPFINLRLTDFASFDATSDRLSPRSTVSKSRICGSWRWPTPTR